MTLQLLSRTPLSARCLATDRADASDQFAEDSRERFDHVSVGLLNADEVFLDGIAWQVARLAKSLAEIGGHASYVEARPDRADLIEQLADIAMDALGGPAGAIIRAQARIDAGL